MLINFQCVRENDTSGLAAILNDPDQSSSSTLTPDLDLVGQLCHPLCSCEKCRSLLSRSKDNTNATVTIFSRGEQGETGKNMSKIMTQPTKNVKII